jgi:hypothetical protein
MQALDARCDVFALGALGYYLLTGRHAYPARELAELRQCWQRRPLRPDALNAEVPRALADLVIAMLSLDPRGRPDSAAEVLDRLGAVCELPGDGTRSDAQAFLSTPKLVGRGAERAATSQRLQRAMRGRGIAMSLVAPAGLGRSRLLSAVLVEAKLLGAAAIGVDASAVGSGPFAVAGALAERLLDALPLAAAAANELAPVLGHLSPRLQRALFDPQLAELSSLNRARKLSSALVKLFDLISAEYRLVIAVDDVHRADGASLAVLGQLSLLAPERRLLLVSTCDAAALANPPPALRQLCEPSARVELAPLQREHVHELLQSLFGTGPEVGEAASWLHELSHGSPQTCMQYAQYLVDQGIARYQGGRWVLPRHLRDQALPRSLDAMLEARLSQLGADARALALSLALARDDGRAAWQPEILIRLEDYPALIGSDAASAFRAVDELLRAGVIEQRDEFYVLGQRAMIDALLRITDEPTRKRAHVRLAEVFLQPGYRGGMLPILHLQHAGEDERARALIVQHSTVSAPGTPYNWGAMRVSVTTQCGIRALAHYEGHGGSPREGVLLRRVLMLACSVYDWSNSRVGTAQIAQLRADSGAVHFEQTDPALPPLARILECIKRAQEEYERKPEPERGFAPLEALRELGGVCVSLSGASLHMHDLRGAEAVPAYIAPLRAVSPAVDVLGRVCVQAVDRLRGRDIGERHLQTAYEVGAATSLPDIVRIGLSVILLHEHVVEDATIGRQRALELMDTLASLTGDDLFYVIHGRWLAHAFAGRAKLARAQRRHVEVITDDDVWRRNAFLFIEAQLHALTGDLTSLQLTVQAIAELAAKFAGWLPWLAYARAEAHRLRGELDAARDALREALALAQPGEHRAWVAIAPAYAELLLARGELEAAAREAEAIIAHVQNASLDRSAAVAAQRVRALAAARQLDHEHAQAQIERAFELAHELGYDGLPLARLYEARASIALAAGDASSCAEALGRLWLLIEHADAPSLFQSYEALREASTGDQEPSRGQRPMLVDHDAMDEATQVLTQVRTRLTGLNDRSERARHALRLLVDDCGARAGHLFLFDASGVFAAASVDLPAPSGPLGAAVQSYLHAELSEEQTAFTDAELPEPNAVHGAGLTDAGQRLIPVLLCDGPEGATAGIVLLPASDAPTRFPRAELAAVIAGCLLAAGDTVPQR